MQRTSRTFHFGGDHSSLSRWIARVPVFINNSFGYVEGFIIPGETPMLMGRPIMENLGIVINFRQHQMMFDGHDWRPITLGRHGEYLLSLIEAFDLELSSQPPHFDLKLNDKDAKSPGPSDTMDFEAYRRAEHVFLSSEDTHSMPGERNILLKHWKMIEHALASEEKRVHSAITQALHDATPRPRLIWEVYAGESRMNQIAESLGCHVESFGYETGWDFDKPSHRQAFLQRLATEMPDEVFLAPRCGLWSRMQAINATTPEKKQQLQELRQQHHDCHLRFTKQTYMAQVHGGRQAHVEQPHGALSWETNALRKLPGLYVVFDQRRYGACCLDVDGLWKPVQKSTGIKTTKRALAATMNLRCDRSHEHCRLEGQFPGLSRTRTSYMEDCQPCLAANLAAALSAPEDPQAWDDAFAVEEVKAVQGRLVQLMTNSRAEAVRTVQRLHRNLGHPSPESLTEMLESRGASENVLQVARQFLCQACVRYRKPNQVAPASVKSVLRFNQAVRADVFWLKSGETKFPVLSVIDEGTKFQKANLIDSEKSIPISRP